MGKVNSRLITQDVRSGLAGLPEESVHCVITSIPYFGLRSYKTEPQLWGGSPDCQHEWSESPMSLNRDNRNFQRGTQDEVLAQPTGTTHIKSRSKLKQGLCIHCGCWTGEHGLEPTIDLYIQHEVEVWRAVRRVMRADGVAWLNVGDSYAGNSKAGDKVFGNPEFNKGRPSRAMTKTPDKSISPGLKPKDLCLVPYRLALALQADGWWVRSAICWSKGESFNPDRSGSVMPESVNGWRWERHRVKTGMRQTGQIPAGWRGNNNPDKQGRRGQDEGIAKMEDCPGCPVCAPNDGLVLRRGSWRPTSAYEMVYMLTKSECYFGDAQAVREYLSVELHKSGIKDRPGATDGPMNRSGHSQYDHDPDRIWGNLAGRNLRNVWAINPEPTKEKHYATFPTRLVEPMIKSSTSEAGCCPKCGSQWVRVVEQFKQLEPRRKGHLGLGEKTTGIQPIEGTGLHHEIETHTLGFRPTCTCPEAANPVPCTILDPFCGISTVGEVALRLGRQYIGIDLQPSYIEISRKRLEKFEKRLNL